MNSGVIVFASCMDAERCPQQPVWSDIRAREEKPDLLLLLGDQIYMDWGLSLRKEPRLKAGFGKLSPKRQAERLKLFATEMHMRYSLQWGVPEFFGLVTEMVERKSPGAVMLSWDEHDFAWNNAYGADAAQSENEADPNSVPALFKAIAWQLRCQFESVLRNPRAYVDAASGKPTYPPLPDLNDNGTEPQLVKAMFGKVPVLLLEQRWYRTQRDQEGATLLGDKQWEKLTKHVQAGRGLLVLAGSSPLRHDYLLAEQGWYAPEGRSYKDFERLLSLVAEDRAGQKLGRPILYLGGDIHRNAYGGRIQDSSLVQALSSGAGLGNLVFKSYVPSYGVVRISDVDQPENCDVGLSFVSLGKPTTEVPLHVKAGHWSGKVPDGSDVKFLGLRHMGEVADLAPLLVVCGRRRQKEDAAKSVLALQLNELDDRAYGDETLGESYRRPDVVTVQGNEQSGALHIGRNLSGQEGFEAQWAARWQAAFDRAAAHGRNVVFFIHGFNKSFVASLNQAYALRALYPRCEPVLYSWASGEAGGVFKTAAEFTQARENAETEAERLRAALSQLVAFSNTYQGRVRPPVIVARSLGALALAHAMPGTGGDVADALLSRVIRRIVLSAPALPCDVPVKWQKAMCKSRQAEVVVTVNANDRILRDLKRVGGGKAIGQIWPEERSVPGMHYINFTGWSSVMEDHDYLLQTSGDPVDALNSQLLSGAEVNWPALGERHRG